MAVSSRLLSLSRKEVLRERYRGERKEKGAYRERFVLYGLRILLRPRHEGEEHLKGFVIRRIPGKKQRKSSRHLPDIYVRYRGHFIAEIEVTGTELAWHEMVLKGRVFVLPSKARYGARKGKRYIFAFFNDWEFPIGDWLLWLNGEELNKLILKEGEIWEGETRKGVWERYWHVPKEPFRGSGCPGGAGLLSLAHYLKWLAGLEKSPDMWALENFMPG